MYDLPRLRGVLTLPLRTVGGGHVFSPAGDRRPSGIVRAHRSLREYSPAALSKTTSAPPHPHRQPPFLQVCSLLLLLVAKS